jgi:hypothetical protein
MMNRYRNILVVQTADTVSFRVKNDFYARPQTIVYVHAKNKAGLLAQLDKYKKEIVTIFRDSDLKHVQSRFAKTKVANDAYKTLTNLGLSLTIPKSFRTVDDTGEFLWLRHHLMSGIAKGDGTNNILVYSMPIKEAFDLDVNNHIIENRNTIGEKYIPGAREGMYMITEAAFTPQTKKTTLANRQAFETRGKWEVKNNFMAGPFLNYTIVDKENNRLVVVEGFTYAPSVNKRDFIFELEAIAKSIVIQ